MTCTAENTCRNTSNPSNSLCLATPGIQTNDRSCNQYCANNNDCGTGLTCFWNRCREPKNLDSSSCEVKTVATKTIYSSGATKGGTNVNSYTDASGKTVLLPSEAYDLTTSSCNQGCNNNRDCEADMRCYKGKCRLAENPEEIACGVKSTADKDKDASNSGAKVEPSATPAATSNNESSNIGKILSSFSWQWLAFAGAILLIAITLIVASIAKAKRDPWQSDSMTQFKKPEETIKIPEDKPLQF